MRRLSASLAAVMLACCLAPAGAACPLTAADGERVGTAALGLAWRAEPAPLRVGQPFALWVSVCPASAGLVAIDATMPEHRHGMNYRPSLQPLGDGRWRAEGLLWHMAGRWELRFDLQQGDTRHSLRHSVMLR